MNGKIYLIDSVILIDHLNGIIEATNWLKKNTPSISVISVITRAEILVGTSKSDMLSIKTWLDSFECISISKEIADLAAICRNKYGLKLPDSFQTAIALKYKLQLVTRNTKDFKNNMEFVKIPYEI
ncbi:MAG: PIN domain-containing protein [Bacteroidetes bacterium]|nr:PIN domain-containing protein [Bacteroidota bacterium]MBU1116501.1 PIN domain-containing protein [Bacteroidota bacterium]MBU1797155.1 PIN domain-containing protein [Bacteroidota bacterium]